MTRMGPPCRMRGREYVTQPQYYVYQRTGQYAVLRDSENTPRFRSVPYQGMTYCATTPSHTLVVRRNWKPVVVGNCVRYLCISHLTYDHLMHRTADASLTEAAY